MRGMIFRWLINAGGLLLVSHLFDGIQVAGLGWALIAALFLGVVNALIRPVVLILTLPINILSLGLFTFVINALMLWLVGNLLAGFRVEGFWPALGGSLVLSLISFAVNSLVNDQGRWEVIELRRDRRGVWRER
ncbi:MAG: phage holin family protein [Desulfarculus sp.]|nr:phage holin family protein [Desulfarculus sp.]